MLIRIRQIAIGVSVFLSYINQGRAQVLDSHVYKQEADYPFVIV